MRDVIIGRSNLEEADAERRIASGTFRPAPGYELVQPMAVSSIVLRSHSGGRDPRIEIRTEDPAYWASRGG